jgi:hypothetical protein
MQNLTYLSHKDPPAQLTHQETRRSLWHDKPNIWRSNGRVSIRLALSRDEWNTLRWYAGSAQIIKGIDL